MLVAVDGAIDWTSDCLLRQVFGRMVARLPCFFNMALIGSRLYFQRNRSGAGSSDQQKKRVRRALTIGLQFGLWQVHEFEGKGQALYVREPVDKVPGFFQKIFPFVIENGGQHQECISSSQDVSLHHRSLKKLYSMYRWKVGHSARTAQVTPPAIPDEVIDDDARTRTNPGDVYLQQSAHCSSEWREVEQGTGDAHGSLSTAEFGVLWPGAQAKHSIPLIAGFKTEDAKRLVGSSTVDKAQALTLQSIRICDATSNGCPSLLRGQFGGVFR